MKNLILLVALVLSWHASAHIEHRPGLGEAPASKRMQLAKQCFSEAVASGCRGPREDRREFRSCVRDTLKSFSPECQTFITKKYGPVKN